MANFDGLKDVSFPYMIMIHLFAGMARVSGRLWGGEVGKTQDNGYRQ